MKNLPAIALFACMLIAAARADAQGIVFEKAKFSELLTKAKEQDKLIFIDVYATWCGPCRRMAEEVFTDKSVGDFFNANFINAKFDAERGEGVWVASRYKVDRYPTFLLVDGNGVLQGTMIGGSPAADFIRRIGLLAQKARERMGQE